MLLDLGHRSIRVYPLIICRSSRRYHQYRYCTVQTEEGRGGEGRKSLIDASRENIKFVSRREIDQFLWMNGGFCPKIV